MGKTDLETMKELFRDHREHSFIGIIKQVGPADDRSALRVQVQVMPDLNEIVAYQTTPFAGSDSGDWSEPDVGDLVIGLYQRADLEEPQAFIIATLPSKSDQFPVEALGGNRVIKSKPGKDLYLITQEKLEARMKSLKILCTQLAELTAENQTTTITEASNLTAKNQTHTIEETSEVIAAEAYLNATDVAGISAEKIYLGKAKGPVTEPLVLGLVLKTFLTTVVDTLDGIITELTLTHTDLGTHTHLCALPATPGGPPLTAAIYVTFVVNVAILQVTLLAAKATDLTGDGILSETAFTEK